MLIIPDFEKIDRFDLVAVKDTVLKMVENRESEMFEIHQNLAVVLASKSPWFIHHILQDDEVNIKSPGDIKDRLHAATTKAEEALHQYYWDQLYMQTTAYYYPDLVVHGAFEQFISNKSPHYCFKTIPFSQINVLKYFESHIAKPFPTNEAKSGIIKSQNRIVIESSKVVFKPFEYSNQRLSYRASASYFALAVLLLKHGDQNDWLKLAYSNKNSIVDWNASSDVVKLVKPGSDDDLAEYEGLEAYFHKLRSGVNLSLDYKATILKVLSDELNLNFS